MAQGELAIGFAKRPVLANLVLHDGTEQHAVERGLDAVAELLFVDDILRRPHLDIREINHIP